MATIINQPVDYATKVARDTVYGSAKFHLPTSKHEAECGATASTPFGWPLTGDRADFMRLCPERICKRCLKRAAA